MLRRKARARPRVARTGGVGPGRALRLALSRAASEDLALPVTLSDAEARRASLAEVLDLPEDRALHALVQGPREVLGLCVLSPALLSGLIEWQTIRRISTAPPLARAPTRTDAAMVSGLINKVLTAFAAGLTDAPDQQWAGGYRYTSFIPDPRPLGHLLEDVAYRLFLADIAMNGGVRTGRFMLALPAEGRGRAPTATATQAEGAGSAWAASVERAVLSSASDLEAVLARVSLPLSAVSTLRPGALLPVDKAAIDAVRIEAPGGALVCTARLGQAQGHRALRLHAPASTGAGGAESPGYPGGGRRKDDPPTRSQSQITRDRAAHTTSERDSGKSAGTGAAASVGMAAPLAAEAENGGGDRPAAGQTGGATGTGSGAAVPSETAV